MERAVLSLLVNAQHVSLDCPLLRRVLVSLVKSLLLCQKCHAGLSPPLHAQYYTAKTNFDPSVSISSF